VDFKNTVILMTSNLGVEAALQAKPARKMGFATESHANSAEDFSHAILENARAQLPPELWNRFDETLLYRSLKRDDVFAIAKKALIRLQKQLFETRSIEVRWSSPVIEHLLAHGGFEPSLGGRPVLREIARQIEAPLAEWLLGAKPAPGVVVSIEVREGAIRLEHPRV
jgi:ATP-dependent Clp protease ATP-binding subunit ClpC